MAKSKKNKPKRKPSPKQLANQKRFTAMVRARAKGNKHKKTKARKTVKKYKVVKHMAKGKQMFAKSKPIFPLVQLVQGLFIMQQATGGRLDDLIYQFIDAIFGVQNAINMDWNRQKINEIIGYVANNPQKVVIDTAIAVGVTAAIRKALQYMGVPALVDIGPFYIKVR